MIQQKPTERDKEYTLTRSLRSDRSNSVIWAENLATGEMYHLLRWGNMLYLPVEVGDHIGIGIFNDSPTWKAYPMYVEALNVWEGGQSEPENCDVSHMWEIQSYRQMTIDALMNPHAQAGRPLIVTRSGEGLSIGESTFGTTAYRGQIRVYERDQMHLVRHYPVRPLPRPLYAMGRESTHEPGPSSVHTPGSSTLGVDDSTAAIGAGEEEYRGHHHTGIAYAYRSMLVASFQVEFRKDLQPMLNRAWGKQWSWFWPRPSEPRWFDEPWTWMSPRRHRTSPQVPVIQPHTGGRVHSS